MAQARHRTRTWLIAILIVVIAAALLLRFGGEILAPSPPLPRHAQVAVALNGSIAGVLARTTEAMRLLQQGVVDHVIVSIPPTGYWGESIPPEANAYFTRHFGATAAARILYCVSTAESTIEEAHAIGDCLASRHWQDVIIVTSNYHVRRARRIWRAAIAKAHSPVAIHFDGVADGSFEPRGWWRERIYAKTWLMETTKLVWETFFGLGPWPGAMPSGTLQAPSGGASNESSTLGSRYKN